MTNFFSTGLRQKVDQLIYILWAGGVNNPMDSIEQCSYLLFLRLLTEKDETLASLDKKYVRIFSGKWSRSAWGNFVTLTSDNLFNAVRDAIEHLHELPIRTSDGEIRWMDVSAYLKRESADGKMVRQIIFEGERFDAVSVQNWRKKVLNG